MGTTSLCSGRAALPAESEGRADPWHPAWQSKNNPFYRDVSESQCWRWFGGSLHTKITRNTLRIGADAQRMRAARSGWSSSLTGRFGLPQTVNEGLEFAIFLRLNDLPLSLNNMTFC